MDLFNPSIEQLVTEIIAVNHAWKEAKNLFALNTSLADSLRDLKARLQIRLLRSYAPKSVYLMADNDPNEYYDEPLYGLGLTETVNGRKDAAHMPIRVAQQNLSALELKLFVKI